MPGDWNGILDVLDAAGALKRIPRQGWVYIDVPEPESVADHSYRLAVMALLLARITPDADPHRAVTLALLHDLPEAITGDLTPLDQELARGNADRERVFSQQPTYSETADRAKQEAEQQALATITHRLPAEIAQFLTDAWQEYEDNQTPEARLVRQLDKLEALLQGYEYRLEQPDLPVRSFELGTSASVRDPALRDLLAALSQRFAIGPDPG